MPLPHPWCCAQMGMWCDSGPAAPPGSAAAALDDLVMQPAPVPAADYICAGAAGDDVTVRI